MFSCFTDVRLVGRETIARNSATRQLPLQVCDLIIYDPKYNSIILSHLVYVNFMLLMQCFVFVLISVGIAIGVTVAVVLLLIAFIYAIKRNPKMVDRLRRNLPSMPTMPSMPSVSNFVLFR